MCQEISEENVTECIACLVKSGFMILQQGEKMAEERFLLRMKVK
jgi:hypothetical protein